MQVEIKRIQKELNITTIIVTHDHEEAVSLADRVIVMNAGQILQVGSPYEVFDHPNSAFIADFMGYSTFIQGTMGGEAVDGKRPVTCSGHTIMVSAEAAEGIEPGASVTLATRSEHMELVKEPCENVVEGKMQAATYKGHTTRLEVKGCFDEVIYPAANEYIELEAEKPLLVYLPVDKLCVYKNNA
jgi:ABC-type Fe3+/spermidine/putrescine transport system ATPase subunit